jgi:hypothetical protein
MINEIYKDKIDIKMDMKWYTRRNQFWSPSTDEEIQTATELIELEKDKCCVVRENGSIFFFIKDEIEMMFDKPELISYANRIMDIEV